MASISPSASIADSVWRGPMARTRKRGGRLSGTFSSRPGSSSPPVKYSTLVGSTPYSSCRMPRIHTGAVSWYSGTPMRLPARSLRLADAALRRDEDAVVAEEARGKHRNGDEGRVLARQRHRIGGQRHLRRVELAVAQHAEERLLDRQLEDVEIDALGRDAAVGERADAVVVPAGKGQAQLRHRRIPWHGAAARL